MSQGLQGQQVKGYGFSVAAVSVVAVVPATRVMPLAYAMHPPGGRCVPAGECWCNLAGGAAEAPGSHEFRERILAINARFVLQEFHVTIEVQDITAAGQVVEGLDTI